MADKDESWAPKTREEWVELFADGQLLAGAKRDEAEAKAKAAAGTPPAGSDPEPDKKPLTLAERILGVSRT